MRGATAARWGSEGATLPVSAVRRAVLAGAAVAALGVALAGCAFRHDPFSAYAPPLYEVTDAVSAKPAGRLYLFGGIHAGLSRFYPLPEAVEAAWQRSTRLAVELDGAHRHDELRAAFATRTQLPPGTTLENLVAPDVLRAIRDHYGFGRREWEARLRMQPWALEMLLIGQDDERIETESRWSVDAYFLRRARADGRPVIELETADAQLEAFAGGTLEEQAAALTARFRRIQDWDRTMFELVDAWRLGDDATLARIKDRTFGPCQPTSTQRERVFGQRDRAMADRLAALLREGDTVFVVVGALHLVGPDSLPALLRARGLEVRRVE